METIGADLRRMQRTPLAASHVRALRAVGKVATYPAKTFLARPGDPMDRFIYIEEGEIEVVNPYTDERHLPRRSVRPSSWAKSPSSTVAPGRCPCARLVRHG